MANLNQIITPQKAKLGPDNNSTTFIYLSIYIYIYIWQRPYIHMYVYVYVCVSFSYFPHALSMYCAVMFWLSLCLSLSMALSHLFWSLAISLSLWRRFCSLPMSFILIASVIVAGLQFMARNERRKGCPEKSLSFGSSPASSGFASAEQAERKTSLAVPKQAWNLGAWKFVKFASKNGTRIYSTEKFNTMSRLPSPKIHACFRTFFLGSPPCSPWFILPQTLLHT